MGARVPLLLEATQHYSRLQKDVRIRKIKLHDFSANTVAHVAYVDTRAHLAWTGQRLCTRSNLKVGVLETGVGEAVPEGKVDSLIQTAVPNVEALSVPAVAEVSARFYSLCHSIRECQRKTSTRVHVAEHDICVCMSSRLP